MAQWWAIMRKALNSHLKSYFCTLPITFFAQCTGTIIYFSTKSWWWRHYSLMFHIGLLVNVSNKWIGGFNTLQKCFSFIHTLRANCKSFVLVYHQYNIIQLKALRIKNKTMKHTFQFNIGAYSTLYELCDNNVLNNDTTNPIK